MSESSSNDVCVIMRGGSAGNLRGSGGKTDVDDAVKTVFFVVVFR